MPPDPYLAFVRDHELQKAAEDERLMREFAADSLLEEEKPCLKVGISTKKTFLPWMRVAGDFITG